MVELPSSAKKTLRNVSLAVKAAWRVEKQTQYTNHQMNNAVKNQTYPNKSQ